MSSNLTSRKAGVPVPMPSMTKPVSDAHKIDMNRLSEYMRQNVAGFKQAESVSKLEVLQFSHGQSNPTYFLQVGDPTAPTRYVLRKKPPGNLLPSAHAIEREYRVLTALRGSRVPVPRTYALCTDPAVIGTAFYIMEYVEGRIFKDISLPHLPASGRTGVYLAMNRVLAEIHRIDYKAVGLENYGKTNENYVERQVKRWSDQYEKSKTGDIPDMDELRDHLLTNLPRDDDSKRITLIHGDFRLDNLIFHPREYRIIAVLDWELSTLGHPTTDLAYNCVPYHVPATSKINPGLTGRNLEALGIPSEASYIRAYIRNSQQLGSVKNYQYYLALSFFRMAGIGQGVYKRSLQGNASSDLATLFGETTKLVAKAGLLIAKSACSPVTTDESKSERLRAAASLGVFNLSPRFFELRSKLLAFMDEYIYPNEATFIAQHQAIIREKGSQWHYPPILEELKSKAKELGLWNLFLTKNKDHSHSFGAGLTNIEYAPLCEILGRSVHLAPEACNCSAPDTGNMEVLALYGTPQQQDKWLKPLLNGDIRSCFGMTEPLVASSDATNIEASIERAEDGYIINARKWWTSGAMDPRCKVCILMGKMPLTRKTGSKHAQQSMILVPMDAPGVKILRPLHVYGYDDAPHGHAEVEFVNVKVPLENMLLGEGRGFEIAQGRLGPGRIHHCMRLIGMAERALEMMIQRVHVRHAFGTQLAAKGKILSDIGRSRIEIDQCRLLTLQAAAMMDSVGNKLAQQQIAMIKVAAPNMACRVIDRAIQAHGGQGVNQDTMLPWMWAGARSLRLADGPDEVHIEHIARLELARASRL